MSGPHGAQPASPPQDASPDEAPVWMALVVDPLPRRAFDALSDALFALGAQGVQEEGAGGVPIPPRQPWDTEPEAPPPDPLCVRAWFEGPDEAAIVAELALPPGVTATWEPVEDTDWSSAWQAGFPILRVSDRLVICPPWDVEPGALIIEPGQGFGTGQHTTTQQSLVALDRLTPAAGGHGTVLDAGCGSAILALAAARLGWHAEGFDIDPTAIVDARAQADRNGIHLALRVGELRDEPRTFDLVLANLFAETLVAIAPDLRRVTGAHLVLAGILADKEPSVRAAFDPHLRLIDRDLEGEWVCLVYARSG